MSTSQLLIRVIIVTTLSIIIPILHMEDLSHREVKQLAQGHTAGKWQNLEPRPVSCQSPSS